MVRLTGNGFHVFIFLILFAMGRSFSHARQVKEVKILSNEKEFVVEANNNFNLHKETQPDANPNAEAVETLDKISRKVSTSGDEISVKKTSKEKTRKSEQGKSRKRVAKTVHDGEQNWKEYFTAFSADYRTPKSHPPKNN